MHDHASHGADSARYLALGVRESEVQPIDSAIFEQQQFSSRREWFEHRGLDSSWMSR